VPWLCPGARKGLRKSRDDHHGLVGPPPNKDTGWWFGTIWDKLFGFHHISLLLDFPFICLYLVYYIMVLFSIIYGIILPIDKLIFFKMVKLNHQTRKTLETFSGSMGSMLVGGMVFCSFFRHRAFSRPSSGCALLSRRPCHHGIPGAG
jgi:hypothetical protein